MTFRPPTSAEIAVWLTFRDAALRRGGRDPGPVPEEWPADPEASGTVLRLLANAAANDRDVTAQEMASAFGR